MHIDMPNLDAMDADDLREFAKRMRALADYAAQKAHAMALRSDGKINLALVAEAKADEQYNALPKDLRW